MAKLVQWNKRKYLHKSQRVSFVHQYGRHSFVLVHQHGRRDVMWKRSIKYKENTSDQWDIPWNFITIWYNVIEIHSHAQSVWLTVGRFGEIFWRAHNGFLHCDWLYFLWHGMKRNIMRNEWISCWKGFAVLQFTEKVRVDSKLDHADWTVNLPRDLGTRLTGQCDCVVTQANHVFLLPAASPPSRV